MTERNYGIDLFRMVSMLMVAILHILGHGGGTERSKSCIVTVLCRVAA